MSKTRDDSDRITMKKITSIGLVLAFLAGFLAGPAMLESAHAAQPPFTWPSIFLLFFGILFGLPFVIGIQLFRSDPKFARMGVACFGTVAILLFASGLSALVVGLIREGFTPQSFVFLAAGVAMLIAVSICRVLSQIKTRKHARS